MFVPSILRIDAGERSCIATEGIPPARLLVRGGEKRMGLNLKAEKSSISVSRQQSSWIHARFTICRLLVVHSTNPDCNRYLMALFAFYDSIALRCASVLQRERCWVENESPPVHHAFLYFPIISPERKAINIRSISTSLGKLSSLLELNTQAFISETARSASHD